MKTIKSIEVTDRASENDDQLIFDGLKEYCEQYVDSDMQALSVFIRDEDGKIIAGLTGKSYWGVLHVDYVWVDTKIRGLRLGSRVMDAAEQEAIKRGCESIVLDTMSFQAQPFYEKRGYDFIGPAGGYRHGITRNYMVKYLKKNSMTLSEEEVQKKNEKK